MLLYSFALSLLPLFYSFLSFPPSLSHLYAREIPYFMTGFNNIHNNIISYVFMRELCCCCCFLSMFLVYNQNTISLCTSDVCVYIFGVFFSIMFIIFVVMFGSFVCCSSVSRRYIFLFLGFYFSFLINFPFFSLYQCQVLHIKIYTYCHVFFWIVYGHK